MNGNNNTNILIYKTIKEIEEIKRLIQNDFRIKQKMDNVKLNMIELEKNIKMKENYFKQFNNKEKENANNKN